MCPVLSTAKAAGVYGAARLGLSDAGKKGGRSRGAEEGVNGGSWQQQLSRCVNHA